MGDLLLKRKNRNKQSSIVTDYSAGFSLDPKVAIDIGRGLVTLLIGIATFLLASLSVLEFSDEQNVYVLIILLLSSLTILLAARIIDWMIDRIDLQSWAILYQKKTSKDLADFEIL